MHVNFPNFTFHIFKEKIIPSLSNQQKKILIIASVIFGFLSACYLLLNRSFKEAFSLKKETSMTRQQIQLQNFNSQDSFKENYSFISSCKEDKHDQNLFNIYTHESLKKEEDIVLTAIKQDREAFQIPEHLLHIQTFDENLDVFPTSQKQESSKVNSQSGYIEGKEFAKRPSPYADGETLEDPSDIIAASNGCQLIELGRDPNKFGTYAEKILKGIEGDLEGDDTPLPCGTFIIHRINFQKFNKDREAKGLSLRLDENAIAITTIYKQNEVIKICIQCVDKANHLYAVNENINKHTINQILQYIGSDKYATDKYATGTYVGKFKKPINPIDAKRRFEKILNLENTNPKK